MSRNLSGLADDQEAAEAGSALAPYLNRELSWLDFDARVLALGEDASLPLLERAKFLAILSQNLDEFFQIRVAERNLRLSYLCLGGGLDRHRVLQIGPALRDGGFPGKDGCLGNDQFGPGLPNLRFEACGVDARYDLSGPHR